MAKQTYPSRLSPVYLAKRHAGTLFFFAALGLLSAVAYYCLVQPSVYDSETAISVSLDPPADAPVFDWDGKRREWGALLEKRSELPLLTNNLRHLYKTALTRNMRLTDGDLRQELALFAAPQEFSASLFVNPWAARLGTTLTVSARDLAANLDFQSLAAIISDLDPPSGSPSGWDFTFFRAGEAPESSMVVRPGRDDPYFRVFYHLHDIHNPDRPASSPEEAWRTAVEELAGRIEQESQYGIGRFGPVAARELHREILSIPALAANGLYHAITWPTDSGSRGEYKLLWEERWPRDVDITAAPRGDSGATLSASARLRLNPLAFPRDSALTRVSPLMAATVLTHISAWETTAPATAPAPAAAALAATPVADPEPRQIEPEPVIVRQPRRAVDEKEAEKRRQRIAEIMESLPEIRLERDGVHRRLETARETEKRLTVEAIAARARADRLSERYDAAGVLAERDWRPEVAPETAKLLAAREATVERLTALLQYCTEEHPFVREVRRELDALDILLAGHAPRPGASRDAEARATRLANLYIELETANAAADNLEERRRRQTEAVECVLNEVTEVERRLVQLDMELTRLRETPLPTVSVPALVVEAPPEPPKPVRKPLPEPPPPLEQPTRGPTLVFAAVPMDVPLLREPKPLTALPVGVLAGLLAGLLWAAARELSSSRFADLHEARHMLDRPILAALPMYDPAGYRAAALGMKGDLAGTKKGAMLFVPSPVDFSEPLPAGRRGKLFAARRRPRLLSWMLGSACLLLAAFLYWFAVPHLARPLPGFPDELTLPVAAFEESFVRDRGRDWGDLP